MIIAELIVNQFGKESSFDKPELIVVLGSGNKVNEPLLNDRLEAAIRAHTLYPGIPILLTGDEKNKSETSNMHKYLQEKIPSAKIILDPSSLKTWDSFVFIKQNYPHSKILIITNEFHQKRALMFAHLIGISAKTYGKDQSFSQNWILFTRERISRLLALKYFILR